MKLAEQLRLQLDKIRSEKDNASCNDIVKYVREEAARATEAGNEDLSINISKRGWTIKQAKMAISILTSEDGFRCSIMSNTDRDLLRVFW